MDNEIVLLFNPLTIVKVLRMVYMYTQISSRFLFLSTHLSYSLRESK